MPELAADGPVPELSPEATAKAYEELPPTFGQYAGKVVGESSEMLYGALNRATYEADSAWGKIGRSVSAAGMVESGAVPEDYGIKPDLGPVPTPRMTKQEATARHPEVAAAAPDLFTENMPQGVVDALADSKRNEIEREAVFQRYEQTRSWVTNFPTRTALTLLDPINTAALFIPGVGEEAVLARLGTGVGARMTARAVAGATGGIAGMAPGVGLRLGLSEADAGDYGLRQAFLDLASGAVIGAFVHSGVGAAREAGWLKPDALMRPATAYDATRAAVAQTLDGREVNVEPVLNAATDKETQIAGASATAPPTGESAQSAGQAIPQTEPSLRLVKADIDPELLAQGVTPLYEIEDRNGKVIATARIKIDGDTATIENIYAGENPALSGEEAGDVARRQAQALGTSAVREILRQFRDMHPEVTKLVGERVSGARTGSYEFDRLADRNIEVNLPKLSQDQVDIHQAGSIPSIPATELAAATEELYGPKAPGEAAKAGGEAAAPKPKAAAQAQGEGAVSAEGAAPVSGPTLPAIETPELDRQLAEAEQTMGKHALTTEDHNEILAAQTEAAKADGMEQVYATAADCLKIV